MSDLPLGPTAPPARPRVLVVDDDAHLRRLVRDVLTLEGLEVQTAAAVPAAEALLATWLPDLIVLDIMLPGQSGLEFCRALTARAAVPVPVLFLSARGTPDDKIAGLAEGAVDYLAKPFDPAELVARCQAALRTRARAQAAARVELEQFKSEVLGLIGHELRTPLSLVLGYAELLQARDETLSPERAQHFLEEITAGSWRLTRMLEDVLLLASPRVDQQPLDLRQVVNAAAAESAPRFAEAGVQLVRRGPDQALPVLGAEPLLRAGLRHLLDNAAAFAPAGSTVELDVRIVGPRVAVSVRDRGPGIPPEEQEAVFQRFYQVSRGATRAHGGLGLGLSIARRAAEDHGGEIRLESAVGTGSTFTLTLPLAEPPTLPPPPTT